MRISSIDSYHVINLWKTLVAGIGNLPKYVHNETINNVQLRETLAEIADTEDLEDGPDGIESISNTDEMKRSYLDFIISVIVSRALPDLRDGLKLVHRRILYSTHENGYELNKPYRKSVRQVGDIVGKYHLHGDNTIYDSLVRMAQKFKWPQL